MNLVIKKLSLSLAIVTLSSSSFADLNLSEADAAVQIRQEASKAQELETQMSNFLHRYAVEVIRETVSQQSGEFSGSAEGSLHGVHLGNVPALVGGIVSLPFSIASALNPFQEISSGLHPISNMLHGLSGMGYIGGSLRAEIAGSSQGETVRINDSPHLFLVTVKRLSSFQPVADAIAAMNSNSEYTKDLNNENFNKLVQVYNSPYIVTDEVADQFRNIRDEFTTQIHKVDQILTEQAGSTNPVFKDEKERLNDMKAWATPIRVIFTTAGKGPLPVKTETFKVVCPTNQSAKYNISKVKLSYVGRDNDHSDSYYFRAHKNGCINIPDDRDWALDIRNNVWATLAPRNRSIESSQFYAVKELRRAVMIDKVNPKEDVLKILFDPENMDIGNEERLFF